MAHVLRVYFKLNLNIEMKKIILLIFIAINLLVCDAQTSIILKKDSTKLTLNQNDFNLFKINNNYSIPAINRTFEQYNHYYSSRFSIYYDTIFRKSTLFDNYRNKDYSKYLYASSSDKYNSVFIIGAGAINYLLLLFEKNNIRLPIDTQTM